MKNLIVMVGLPRSGKTTWIKNHYEKYGAAIVSPDEIRYALHGQRFAIEAESFVWPIAKLMVRALFKAGHNTVILDATSITKKRREEWISLTDEWKTFYQVMTVNIDECLLRAAKMEDGYILPIIKRMTNDFEPLDLDSESPWIDND